MYLKKLIAPIFLGLALGGVTFSSYAEDTSQYVDFKTYDSKVTIDHTHIYVTEFDDKYHWERCTICDNIRNKSAHSLHGNGQPMTYCSSYYNVGYRDICSCGYETKPFYVIHGRWENYTSSKTLNYNGMSGVKLDDLLQITKAQFNSNFAGKTHDGQEYTWHDDNGDGLGWVFCGGPIVSSNGIKGSLELVLGKAGDFGRHQEKDELYTLAKYISQNKNLTRSGFVSMLKSKSQLKSNHCLYGLKEKYSSITDSQWNKIRSFMIGYDAKPSTWGYQTMTIKHSGLHHSPGNELYSLDTCYDSNVGMPKQHTTGIETTCDICDTHYNGWETYEGNQWHVDSVSPYLKPGETKNGTTAIVRGYNDIKLGEVYCVYTRKGNDFYITKYVIKTEPGVTANNTATTLTNIPLTKTAETRIRDYTYLPVIYFNYTFNGKKLSKPFFYGYQFPFIDQTAPTISSITTRDQTVKNGWATIKEITISGAESYCSNVKIKIIDTVTGKQIGGTYTAPVSNGSYSFKCTPPLEAPASGRTYKVQVIDLYGNTSEKTLTIYKTDGSAPKLTNSSTSYLDWTGVKTITLNFTDYGTGMDTGIGGIWVSFGDQKNFQKIAYNKDGKYSITYKFGKEVTGGVKYRVYVKDGLGNVAVNNITVGNIDRTAPVIKDATVKYGSKSAVVNATDERSGIVGYGISTDAATVPKTWQTGNTLSQNEYGDYYVFVKDKAGNISTYKKVTLGIFEIYYKLDGGTNDGGNPSTYTINDRVIFKDPSKRGYDFIGWYTDSGFTNEIKSIEKGSTENKTLYAKWEPITYYIMYNFYGGQPAAYDYPKTYTIETPSFTLENPTYDGKIFMGWSDWNNAQRKTTYTIPKGSIGDLVISANWDVNTDGHGNGNNGDGGNGTGNKEITGSSNITSNKFNMS